MRCRKCQKREYIASNCWQEKCKGEELRQKDKGKYNKDTKNKCYLCQSSNHLMADCDKNPNTSHANHKSAKYNGVDNNKKFDQIKS